jgi:phosphoribosylformylglycinamidine cyclo-ligase
VYSGKYKLTDPAEGTPVDVGQLVLSPTRTYAPIIVEILRNLRQHIHGMVHCSGGAQTKVLHFIDNLHIIKDNLFPIAPLFTIIHDQSGTDWKEMYKVFNMGHRMELYVNEAHAQSIIDISERFGVEAKIIGRVEAAQGKQVTVKSETGTFIYQ